MAPCSLSQRPSAPRSDNAVIPAVWPCPLPEGGFADEYALIIDHARAKRVLIVPALFDEANRMRRFTAELMRRLDNAGIDSVLPDLPGTNESLEPLDTQTGSGWRAAMAAAAAHFGVTHVLAVRGGCLYAPGLPGWHYAPAKGALLLRQMMRARILASREAGREETQDELTAIGAREGLDLSGHRIGPALLGDLQAAEAPTLEHIARVAQDEIGGSGLWLRAEPGEAPEQADALAKIIAEGIAR